uniref:ABC transporter permease n=1 Tax=Amphimedon queenslandica TaxID=400682 RepID=A0A1X7U039_AMPQE
MKYLFVLVRSLATTMIIVFVLFVMAKLFPDSQNIDTKQKELFVETPTECDAFTSSLATMQETEQQNYEPA